MGKTHTYRVEVEWTGNHGSGTSRYDAYGREHRIQASGKTDIAGSSDPAFRGDPTRWNPEDLLVASVSACHKLWYLHLCAVNGVNVVSYLDRAEGTMAEDADGSGRFTEVVLRPEIVVTPGSNLEKAETLHVVAHAKCFIANSVNFPVRCEPRVSVG